MKQDIGVFGPGCSLNAVRTDLRQAIFYPAAQAEAVDLKFSGRNVPGQPDFDIPVQRELFAQPGKIGKRPGPDNGVKDVMLQGQPQGAVDAGTGKTT